MPRGTRSKEEAKCKINRNKITKISECNWMHIFLKWGVRGDKGSEREEKKCHNPLINPLNATMSQPRTALNQEASIQFRSFLHMTGLHELVEISAASWSLR